MISKGKNIPRKLNQCPFRKSTQITSWDLFRPSAAA